MPRSALIIGAGQIGFAGQQAFVRAGWQVQLLARSCPAWLPTTGCSFSRWQRGQALPPADAVLDTIAYDAADLDDHNPTDVGRLITVSSASVYCDAQNRTLDEAAQHGFPEFSGPITEEQSTVEPGPQTYSTRNVRMERAAADLFGDRATILRPCAVHGSWTRHPREWWFVKRLLDKRSIIPLAFEGQSRFQTTSAAAIASFALHAAERELGGVFNLPDADTLDVAQIGDAICGALGCDAEMLPLPGLPVGAVGRTPWSVPKPFVISAAKAVAAGYASTSYRDTVRTAAAWLRGHAPMDWQAAFPQLAAYPWNLFDYAAEDTLLETL